MKFFNDKKLRIIGPFVLFLVGTLFFRLDWYLKLPVDRLVRSDLIGLIAGYICWNLARWVAIELQKRYPGLANTRRRLFWMALLMPLLVNFAWLIRQLAHAAFNNESHLTQTLSDYTYSVGIQIFYHCIYFVIYEGGYVLRAWQQTYEQNERLKKNKLQHQLDTLKSQINPHFLFNSLNSLSMLIYENPRQAETLVDEISSVYRYLLRANDQALTTLGRELQFIRSYFHLLQTRYQAGLVLDLSIDPSAEQGLIPPLTLQVLVQNAVRYNVILPAQPLHIHMYTTPDHRLVVANTLQRKILRVETTGAGLSTLATRYELINGGKLVVEEQPGWFVVSLPLVSEGRLAEVG